MYLSNRSKRKIGEVIGDLGYDEKIRALIKQITDTHIQKSTNNAFIYAMKIRRPWNNFII